MLDHPRRKLSAASVGDAGLLEGLGKLQALVRLPSARRAPEGIGGRGTSGKSLLEKVGRFWRRPWALVEELLQGG